MTARKMTTVRLNAQTLATLRELRETHGLSSDAAAIEYLAAIYRDRNKNGDKKMEKESTIKYSSRQKIDVDVNVYDALTEINEKLELDSLESVIRCLIKSWRKKENKKI